MEPLSPIDVLEFRTLYRSPPPAEVIVPEDQFRLVFVDGGLTSCNVQSRNGKTLLDFEGDVEDLRIILLPPGSRSLTRHNPKFTAGFVASFRCPYLAFDEATVRYFLTLPDGKFQTLAMHLPVEKVAEGAALRVCSSAETGWYQHTSGRSPEGGLLLCEWSVLGLLQSLFLFPIAKQRRRRYAPIGIACEAFQGFRSARILDDLTVNIQSGRTLAQIAHDNGLSPDAVRRRFRKDYDRTPQSLKTEKRLQMALGYIHRSEMTFREIAARLGFKSGAYFSTFIRHQTGKSPRELRAEGARRRG